MTLACNCVTFTPGMLNWWPPKLPDAILDYALNITPAIDPSADFAVSAAVSIAPSGAGEMTASNLFITSNEDCSVLNTVLTVTMTGGVPGRTYIIKFDVTMSDQRVFSFLVYQDIPVIIPGTMVPVAPSSDFGTPLISTGGAGNPVISYVGTPVSPFEWTVMPNVGVWLDGALTFPGPTIDYLGASPQNGLTALSIANAAGYLATAGGFTLTATGLTSLLMPNMVSWIGSFAPMMAALTTLNFGALSNFNGSFTPALTALTALALPALVSFGGTFAPTMTSLQAFSMGTSLKVFNADFVLTGAALQQGSVDGVLISLAALDGTLGTAAYSSHTINLSGGSSFAPSAAGLVAKAILQGRGNTVTTN